jgi:hypothetical protein
VSVVGPSYFFVRLVFVDVFVVRYVVWSVQLWPLFVSRLRLIEVVLGSVELIVVSSFFVAGVS